MIENLKTNLLVEKTVSGLAWYSNTMPVRPEVERSTLIINKLPIEGIDYLVIFCQGTKKRRSKRFNIIDLEQSTRMYKKTVLVEDRKYNCKVCVMNCEPCSSVLPDRAVSIKFDNELLYMSFFSHKYVKQFLSYMGLKLEYISRLDIYRDFQSFVNFLPGILIENFAKEKYLCKTHAKFDLICQNLKGSLDWQYLRVGKKSCGRQFYLYNKSTELKEVGNKEHIVNTWLENNFDQKRDVWRLEGSFTNLKRNNILNPITGEMEVMKLESIFSKKFVNKMYEAGLNSNFSFVINEHKRKTRCTPVKLFNKEIKHIKLIWSAAQNDNLRMSKILVKSMIVDILRNKEYREHKSSNFKDRINWINSYVDEKCMRQELLNIISKLAFTYKIRYYDSLSKFLYNYFGKV